MGLGYLMIFLTTSFDLKDWSLENDLANHLNLNVFTIEFNCKKSFEFERFYN